MDRGCLTLTRKLGERIVIGEGADEIVLEVAELGEARVKLNIRAPKTVPVWRAEVAQDRARRAST